MRTGIDLLIYRDFTDNLGADLSIGADAAKELGLEDGFYVVAKGPPIHDSKDMTVVVAAGRRLMPEVQAMLDNLHAVTPSASA
jgi:hypothetical protein